MNILINIAENKVDRNIKRVKTRAKYSSSRYYDRSGGMTSSTRRQRQTDGRAESSRAHARLSKFTSGSRPNSSPPGIFYLAPINAMDNLEGLWRAKLPRPLNMMQLSLITMYTSPLMKTGYLCTLMTINCFQWRRQLMKRNVF